MQLSDRLSKIVSMVTKGLRVADVGTDHGYVPIALVRENISSKVIAMDVNKGPLLKAESNVKDAGLSEYIDLRLGDGLEALKPDEADCVVIAGMGGLLMQRILTDGEEVVNNLQEMVLSPQSDIHVIRRFIENHGFMIKEEAMLIEDGKFYTIIKAVKGSTDTYSDIELKFGRYLLMTKDEVLFSYLNKEKKLLTGILDNLKGKETASSINRVEEIAAELKHIEKALSYYD